MIGQTAIASNGKRGNLAWIIEEILYCEGVEALEEVAQRSSGWPSPVRLRRLFGWGIEQLL